MNDRSARWLCPVAALVLSAGVAAPAHADNVIIDTAPYQAANGEIFTLIKGTLDGVDYTVYERNGVGYTQEEFRTYVRANPAPVIQPALLQKAANLPPGSSMIITVWLKENPGGAIVRAARAEIQPQLDALSARACAIASMDRPAHPMNAAEEKAWSRFQRKPVNPLSPEMLEHRAITRDYEALKARARAKARPLVQAAIAPSQEQLGLLTAQLGGKTLSRLSVVNGAVIELPAASLAALAASPLIATIYEVPPATPELDVQKNYLGHPTFWAAGFDGGIWDPGILDTGIQQNHPTFTGILFTEAPGVGTTDSDGHGTAVTSIVCGRDATFTGMANLVEQVLVGRFASANVQGDAAWMVDTATDDPECINLSAGYGTANDVDYSNFDQFFDALIDNHAVGLAKSTGNNGDGTTTITHPASAYNTLSVANMYDQNTASTADDVITASSSRGPTLNGRNKPDISAPGHNTSAANNDWAGAGADWIQFTGTSSAAPHVTGAMILLTDKRSSDDSKSNKAILLNTADTWSDNGTSGNTADDGSTTGSQWNKTYGWGNLDLDEAEFNGTDLFVSTVDNNPVSATPRFRYYTGTMFANEKATLVWNRHVGWNAAALPTVVQDFTDLDLFCYRLSTGTQLDSSTPSIQNVEQVSVAANETVVLAVKCFSNVDPDVGAESYALATEEGFAAIAAPDLSGVASAVSVGPGEAFNFQVTVSNTGGLAAFGVSVSLTVPTGWTLNSGANPQNIGNIAAGGNAVAVWNITAPCTPANLVANLDWTASSFSWGETYTASGSTVASAAPVVLVQDATQTHVPTPKTFQFPCDNTDFCVVGLNPVGADLDLLGDDDPCGASPWQSSEFGGTTRDFVLANQNALPVSTQYARVILFSGTTPNYSVEFDRGFDLAVPSSRTIALAADEIVEPHEFPLTGGKLYRFRAAVTAGTINPALFLFSSTQTFARRGSANASRNVGGAGVTERMNFTPAVTGTYCIVMTNENGAAGTIEFRIHCAADYNVVGGLTVGDIFDFLIDWFANNPEADFDNNGLIQVQDIFAFLTAWFAGC